MTRVLTIPLVFLGLLASLASRGAAQEPIRVTPSGPGDPVRRPPASTLDPTEELARVEAEFVRASFERKPWLAPDRLWPEWSALALGRFGPEGINWWGAELQRLANDLRRIPSEELARAEDYEGLAADLWAASVLVFAQTSERRDPDSYVARVQETLLSLVQSEAQDPVQRRAALEAALEETPSAWLVARRGLVAPTRAWTLEAVQRLRDLQHLLRSDLGGLAALGTAEEEKRLDDLRAQAARSCDTFKIWLEGVPAGTGDAPRGIGAANWRSLVQAVSGTKLTPEELKVRVLRGLAQLEQALVGTPTDEPPGEEPTPEEILAHVRASTHQAADLVREALLFPSLAAGPPVLETRLVRGSSIPGPLARVRRASAGSLLYLENTGIDWTEDMLDTRAAQLRGAALTALALRHGIPGEAFFWEAAIAEGQGRRLYSWNRSVAEGWGLYALDWIMRVDWIENPFLDDEALAQATLLARRLEATRFLASIELHVEGISLQEAAETFRRRSGFDYESALYEARACLHDPMRGVGVLGAYELRDLEQALGESGDPGEALRRTLAAVVSNPNLRPADLRLALIPEDSR